MAAPSGVVCRSALADLLGADAALCDIHTVYRCYGQLLEHKRAVFDHLVDRWRDLFNVSLHPRRAEQGLAQSWQEARPGVDVKLLPQDGELYVYAQSRDRVAKGSQGEGLALLGAEDATGHSAGECGRAAGRHLLHA